MFCKNCGAYNDDTAKFCTNCGTKLEAASAPENTGKWNTEPQYSGSYESPKPEQTANQNGAAHSVIHSLGSSSLMLLAAVALTVTVVLSIFGSIDSNNMQTVSELMDELGIENAELSNDSFGLPAAISTSAVPIVSCIAVWLIYANSKKEGKNTAGLTMLKVVLILGIVGICMLVGSLLMLSAEMFVASEGGFDIAEFGEFSFDTFGIEDAGVLSVSEVVGIVIAAVLVFAVLAVIYYARLLSTVNTVKHTLTTGEPKLRGISAFAAICCFVIAGTSVLSVLGALSGYALTDGQNMSAYSALVNCAGSVVSAVANTCFGILIIKYRDEMKGLAVK